MKRIIIRARREEVFDEVALTSAYRSIRRENSKSGGELEAMGGSDRRVAHWFFDDSVARGLTHLRPFVRGVVNSDEKFEVELELEDSWPDSLKETAELHLKAYMVQSVLGRWLEMIDEGESAKAGRQAAEEIGQLLATLYHRAAPVRGGGSRGLTRG